MSDDGETIVVDWIERELGPVRSISRQGRWRPAWFVDAEVKGEPLGLYVRGGREGLHSRFPPLPLAYEAQVQAVFAEAGVKVPRLCGYIEEVPAIVMERLPGRPDIATADSDEHRARLREQLADEMLKMHRIDPARLIALGAPTASDPREVTLLNYRQVEQLYLEGDRLPSPDIEFVRGWIDRNAPPCVEGAAVIAVDSGQFMFEGDEITGMVDFELACVGDRHVDLAALRTRDRIEEIGDLESFYRLYEERGGVKLDRARIAFHWVTFAMIPPLQVAHEIAHPERFANYHEYCGWHMRLMDDALKDTARLCGVELAPYSLPEPSPDRSVLLTRALEAVVENLPAEGDYDAYRRFDLAMGLKYLGDHAAMRQALEREYLGDVEALTGRRPDNAWDADVQMVDFVRSAGPELDGAILQLLFRRNERVYQIERRHFQKRREGMEMA
jgi:aminoglycoside phosphotransferase (APT) family kinase protein